MATILDRIIATTQVEIDRSKHAVPERELIAQLKDAPQPISFLEALCGHDRMRLIAEVKKASPSKGIIRADFHPVEIAKAYAANGAAAISVLTEKDHFQGSLDYLKQIRQAVQIPLLRKDFIVDRYQVLEARAAGADAILLIAECLEKEDLQDLYDYARELGMYVLMELYEPDNLDKVLATGCQIIGINNRDLRTFEVELDHSIRLRKSIPADRCVVSESGIFTADHVAYLKNNGINAILVGESLMRQPNVGVAVKNLMA